MENNPDIRTIEIGGQTLRYALMGPSDADRTLLLFNGIGAGLETIKPFAAHFEQIPILTFDVPGVGGSPAPRFPFAPSAQIGLAIWVTSVKLV